MTPLPSKLKYDTFQYDHIKTSIDIEKDNYPEKEIGDYS